MRKKLFKKLLLSSGNRSIVLTCTKIYEFMLKKYPDIGKKIIMIDFLKKNQIKKLKKLLWGQLLHTDTITLLFDDSVQIYLCLDVIKDNSRKNGNNFYKELSLVLIHSFLHSLNMTDEEAENVQYTLLREFYEK